jgi:hypothetical protein
VRLVGVQRVQRCLGVELTEKAIDAPLRHGRTRLQDPEDGMILMLSFCKFCVSNLFITLDFVLQKANTRANPHYLDVWQPAHQGNADKGEKLVNINF